MEKEGNGNNPTDELTQNERGSRVMNASGKTRPIIKLIGHFS
jgi:hypothetical protein